MTGETAGIHEDNRLLQAKYDVTAWFYDVLDYPWERQYRTWRPGLLADVRGQVLEAGVGSGRNLEHYPAGVSVLGIDICREMIRRAARRARSARCAVELRQEDATLLKSLPGGRFDWIVSTFLCCVMPGHLQPLAIRQFERVLKPGGRIRLLEMVYSRDPRLRRRQERFSGFVERVYGARFDRDTLGHLRRAERLRVVSTRFVKKDVYLVIDCERTEGPAAAN